MSNIEKCIRCEDYESVGEGYGLCMKDAIGVIVISEYEPTKNYAHCEKDVSNDGQYGPMSYQRETKTAYQMQKEGWCDDCVADVRECINQSQCEGYRRYNEKTN